MRKERQMPRDAVEKGRRMRESVPEDVGAPSSGVLPNR